MSTSRLTGFEKKYKASGKFGTEIFSKDEEYLVVKTFGKPNLLTCSLFMENCVIPRPEITPALEIEDDKWKVIYPFIDFPFTDELPAEIRDNTDEMLGIFYDFCVQVYIMHVRAFYHWDIKPQNLMVATQDLGELSELPFSEKECKYHGVVIDFESHWSFRKVSMPIGTLSFMPPEAMFWNQKDYYNNLYDDMGWDFPHPDPSKIDVYQLALSFVLTRNGESILRKPTKSTFREPVMDIIDFLQYFTNEDHDHPAWNRNFMNLVEHAAGGNRELFNLLEQMLSFRAEDRPMMFEVVHHPAFSRFELDLSQYRPGIEVPWPCDENKEMDYLYRWMKNFPVSDRIEGQTITNSIRRILLDWMLETSYQLRLIPLTTMIGLQLVHYVAGKSYVTKQTIQGYGAAAFHIAEYLTEGYDNDPSTFGDWNTLSAKTYGVEKLKQFEKDLILDRVYEAAIGYYHLIHLQTLGHKSFAGIVTNEMIDESREGKLILNAISDLKRTNIEGKEYLCALLLSLHLYQSDRNFVPSVESAISVLQNIKDNFCPSVINPDRVELDSGRIVGVRLDLTSPIHKNTDKLFKWFLTHFKRINQ
jgi:serine/threonine protein kinase